jgi:hypothetical protein
MQIFRDFRYSQNFIVFLHLATLRQRREKSPKNLVSIKEESAHIGVRAGSFPNSTRIK